MSQQYVDALNAGGAHATFFLVGDNMTLPGGYPTVAAMELANGNALGDHTMTHPDITGQSLGNKPLTDAQITQEVQGQAQLVQTQTGYTETLFRPPYGDESQHSFDLVASFGLTTVMWKGIDYNLPGDGLVSGDTFDWRSPPTSDIVSRFMATARDQAVILMHDGYPNTLAAIPQILAGMKSEGLCPGRIVPDPTNADNQFDYNGLPMYLKVVPW
jgi:peptidoglycan/xylan/chitin deacetylase (PgdA/CDA1 family)